MSWQKHIINRLNIRKGYGQLILDKTNVLVHRKFLDYPLLPVEIDYSLAQKLDTDKLITLLEYRDQTGQINLITENNLEKELANAQQIKSQIQIEALKHDLEKSLDNIQDYEEILDIGRTWGQYVYACFESRIDPDFDLMEKVDRIDKYLIEESSKRATLITMSDLAQFYDVNHYQIPFISDSRAALLAKSRTLFAHKNYTGISHGGISLEELIVPFAEVMP